MKVRKYNKKLEEFDKLKIVNSIEMASNSTESEHVPEFMMNRIADQIEDELVNKKTKIITEEDLSNIIENRLMQTSYKEVAKSYITYHFEREKEHFYNSELIKAFEKKLNGSNIENSNANCDERSFSGRMNEAARVLLKDNALKTMSKKYKDNHNNNECYTHDLDSYSSGQHNCFDRNTEFITKDGVRSFNHFNDGEPVTVLANDGTWRDAIVHCYGHKRMQEVVLEHSSSKTDMDRIIVKSTADHRWYLKDGSVTTKLKVGDNLQQLPYMSNFNEVKIESKEDAEMWCLGFAIGDGCDHYNETSIPLCGDKIKHKENFEKAFYRITDKDDKVLCVKRLPVQKQQFLTNKLWKMLSFRQKQLLFTGYLCAYGNYIGNEYPSSCNTADERIVEFVKDLSCLCGYHVRHISHIVHDTNFKKNAQLWNIDFFTNQNYQNVFWKVVDIKPLSHNNSSAWCVEEPVTHSFTLYGGIITGNCLSIPFDPMFEYGIHIKQTDIRKPKSINTFFQLIAVFVQVQSLQQFGGVSATHIDWSGVNYVRQSFFKHFKNGLKYVLTEEDYNKIMSE